MSTADEYISTIAHTILSLGSNGDDFLVSSDALTDITTVNFVSGLPSNNSTMYTGNGTLVPDDFFPKRYSPPPLDWTAKTLIPLYIIIFILAFMGNILVIVTLIQNKRMRTVTNVFLLNLSISDMLLAVFCMPFTFIPVLLRNFAFGAVMCVLIRYLQGVSVSVSCFTLSAISLERYFAICRPLQSRRWQTLSHSYKTILVVWVLAFFTMIPIAAYTKLVQLPSGNFMCIETWDNQKWEKAYAIILVIVLLWLPLILMTMSYSLIAHTLWHGMKQDEEMAKDEKSNGIARISEDAVSRNDGYGRVIAPMESEELSHQGKHKKRFDINRGMRQTNIEKSRAAKKRVIKMLFVLVLEFFVCWTPLYMLQAWIIVDRESARQHLSNQILSVVNLVAYISSCCNPITYCFMNKSFRQGFISAFRCCRRKGWPFGRKHQYSSHYSSSRTVVSHVPTAYDKVQESEEM